MAAQTAYLLADQPSEFKRLQLQARVWEPAGSALLAQLGPGQGRRALEVGCGAMGWLRLLSAWVGPTGTVIGTDVDPRMLDAARALLAAESLDNVELVQDDVFASALPLAGFDLVHARFQLAPLGRCEEQLAVYRRCLAPSGWLVLEDPDAGSWRVNPAAPACAHLIALIEQGFATGGGDFNAGRRLPALLRAMGLEPRVDAHVVALAPGHPYLHLPLQFAASLRPRLASLVGEAALDALLAEAGAELARPDAWGTTFTLVQAWARAPG